MRIPDSVTSTVREPVAVTVAGPDPPDVATTTAAAVSRHPAATPATAGNARRHPGPPSPPPPGEATRGEATRGLRVRTYGEQGEDYRVTGVRPDGFGTVFSI
ncbi:hypothetical protein ACWEJ6_26150, partial [Nonomuraea sp. NPDC004702]